MSVARRIRNRYGGCLILLIACAVTCLLLIVNRIVGHAVYDLLTSHGADQPKLRALIVFLAIIGLLFPEWWLIDYTTERIRRLRRGTGKRGDETGGDAVEVELRNEKGRREEGGGRREDAG
jgi:hypothetical protein